MADTECPDGATCHHRCLSGCFRVAQGHAPLNSAGMGGMWPASVRRAYGTVVQDGAPTSSSPESLPPREHEPSTNAVTSQSPDGSGSGEDPTPVVLEPATVPVIDLTAVLANVGTSAKNMRDWAIVLRTTADRLDADADNLDTLCDTLNGA